MKKILILFLLCLPALNAGEGLKLLPKMAGDLGASEPTAAVTTAKQVAAGTPGSASWALDANEALDLSPAPHITDSRGYWMTVDSADFDRGISLPLSAPGALVRISPLPAADGTVARIALDDLVLISEAGDPFSGDAGIDRFADEEELNKAGSRMFSAGTAVFGISERLGSGELTLFADNLRYDAGRSFVIDVFERDSEITLELGTTRDTWLPGEELVFAAAFFHGESMVQPSRLEVALVAPDGRRFDLTLAAATKQRTLLDMLPSNDFGLWELVAEAEVEIDGRTVRRNARTAFAYNQPTAVFSGDVDVTLDEQGLRADFTLYVANQGSYEVRAVLFGTDAAGTSKPLAVGIASDALQAGDASLALIFDADLIEASGLGAPFIVKDLRLIHQDAMAILHRQEIGFHVIGEITRQ